MMNTSSKYTNEFSGSLKFDLAQKYILNSCYTLGKFFSAQRINKMKKFALILAATLLAQPVLSKGVQATNAYARAVVSGVQQSGAFVTLKNTDATPNVLIGASVKPNIATRTELHTHVNDNGVMRMVEVKDGIPLPANQVVELKPGSYHIMFFDLKTTFSAGKKFPLTLKFKDGSSTTVNVTVKEMQAMQHNHAGHAAGAHQH